MHQQGVDLDLEYFRKNLIEKNKIVIGKLLWSQNKIKNDKII